MVNPHFFFEGKLSREESASALLATLLEQSIEFRRRFCELLEVKTTRDDQFVVEVERNDIDIAFDIGNSTTVIVEAKIASGSKTDGQLAMYYERAKADSPDRLFVCVYVAPTVALGRSEVEQLVLRGGDSSVAISWQQMSDLAQGLADFDAEFGVMGLEKVLRVIANRRTAYFDRSGDRALLYDVVDEAKRLVQQDEPLCTVATWKGKSSVEVYTCGTAISVSVSIHFESNADGVVMIPRENDLPVVTIAAGVRPAVKHAGAAKTQAWWSEIKATGEWVVDECAFEPSEAGWMTCNEPLVGDAPEIARRMASWTLVLIRALSGIRNRVEQKCAN
jgi:hypothetical protein